MDGGRCLLFPPRYSKGSLCISCLVRYFDKYTQGDDIGRLFEDQGTEPYLSTFDEVYLLVSARLPVA